MGGGGGGGGKEGKRNKDEREAGGPSWEGVTPPTEHRLYVLSSNIDV